MKKAMFAGAAALVVTAVAPTVLADSYEYNAELSSFFYPGSGNSNTNFAINTVDYGMHTLELGIKAKKRQGADSATPSYADGSYSVQPGSQAGNPNRWWWNFDYSLDFGTLAVDNLTVKFEIGFDSASGTGDVASQVVRTVSGTDILGLDFNNTSPLPAGVDAWSGTDGLVQNSSNLAFGDVNPGGNTFDMDAVGTYTITINIYDDSHGGDLIGGVTMQTVVVPLPGAAGMALAGMGLIGLRRRR